MLDLMLEVANLLRGLIQSTYIFIRPDLGEGLA